MASIMRMHLQYRLWISDMNADINVLRIFGDYMKELEAADTNTKTKASLNEYKQRFLKTREELDELRHEMHLIKMKLAAMAKSKDETEDVEKAINHKAFRERYKAYRENFTAFRKDFKKQKRESFTVKLIAIAINRKIKC